MSFLFLFFPVKFNDLALILPFPFLFLCFLLKFRENYILREYNKLNPEILKSSKLELSPFKCNGVVFGV